MPRISISPSEDPLETRARLRHRAGNEYDVLIVGSGPVGAAYARFIAERRPETSILMVEAGPRLTGRAGAHWSQVAAQEREKMLRGSRGPDRGVLPLTLSSYFVRDADGAYPGLHLVGGDAMPCASMATCVGGMGVYWGGATPRPRGSERAPFIGCSDWAHAIEAAERLLAVDDHAVADSSTAGAIRTVISEAFRPMLPTGQEVGSIRTARRLEANGAAASTTSVADILDPVAELLEPFEGCFELRSDTLCRSLTIDGDQITGAMVEHLPSGDSTKVHARVVVVAAGPFRTPQLLWASGIRPDALGRYLMDHPALNAEVALDPKIVRLTDDNSSGVVVVPFDDGGHPFLGLVAQLAETPEAHHGIDVGPVRRRAELAVLNWIVRTFPRRDNRVVFSDDRTDWCGMPEMSIEYALGDADLAEIDRGMRLVDLAARSLGTYLPGREPRMRAPGYMLHYMGTVRMGARADGSSVCDSRSKVWGFDNLFVGGQGVIPGATVCNPTLTCVAFAAHAMPDLIAAIG